MNPKVDEVLAGEKAWAEEFRKLRRIILACRLDEELKWGQPCYTLEGKNIVLMHGFKDYCALLFFKGALLKDPAGLLVQQTINVQAGRQIRFTSAKEIEKLEGTLTDYIKEAISLEKSGAKVDLKKTPDFPKPEEFQSRLDRDPALKSAFESLTPGRQRAYLLFFSQPKQSKTRESRVEKSIPRILDRLGLDD
jgi:uncharacterized protein YdeI (YjbR/CyaY-like superfamily)